MRKNDSCQPTHNGKLLTVSEAANVLRVSQRTIRRMLADGRLNAVFLGRSVRLSSSSIEELIHACTQTGPNKGSDRAR